MRILLITETAPYPLDSGGRIKTWHTLAALSREHEVHCHAFVRTEQQRRAANPPLSAACHSATLHLVPRGVPREAWHLARSLAWAAPLTVVRHFSNAVLRRIAADCADRRIDVVYCDHLSTMEYGRRLGLPIVHDAHNVEHRIVERYAAGLARTDLRRPLLAREARLLRSYEAVNYRRAALVLAVSETDAEAIRALAPGVPVVAVPIAVDASAMAPVDVLTDEPVVAFVGALDWPPNADAVDHLLSDIWPAVLAGVPGARLTVVGRGESGLRARWRAVPSVHFTGWVDDVEPWFRRSRAMVVPLRSGSGMRVKILDAFARGIPVVTTSVGVEGIDARHRQHALIADTPAAFAAAIVGVLRDRALAHGLSRAGRALALDRYDVGIVGRCQLEALKRLRPATL
jgi:glycosyltransferase involved in cell wall biosynthesis